MEKEKTCCFSGHRPNKLPWGYNETSKDCVNLIIRLGVEIEQMRKKGVTTFLTGMAMGTDIIAAELVLDLKYAYPEEEIRLVAVIPYNGQSKRWNRNYQIRYETILEQADERIILSPSYTKSCMHKRNRYMVDHSAHLIAVYHRGEEGGTIDYARRKGLEIVIIDPNDLSTEI